MKRPFTKLGAILAITPAALLAQSSTQPANSSPAATPDQVIELPAFTVSEAHADPYRASDALSAARIKTSLVDTPATINVITLDFIQDIGANSLLDATQYMPGISAGRIAGTDGLLDRMLIRGFENSGRTVDNIATSYQAQVNPELIERVEVVKGPNAILSPTGSPGGSINVLTKAPKFRPQNDLVLEAGRYFAQKATVDSTGAVAGSNAFAYRLVASYQDAKSFVPGSIVSWDINPSLLYKISDKAQVIVRYTHQDWKTKGTAAVPSSTVSASPLIPQGGYVSVDKLAPGTNYDGRNGVFPSWAVRADKLDAFSAELTTALSSNINMRAAAATNTDKFMEDDVAQSYGNAGNAFYDPYTGIYTPLLSWSKDPNSNQYIATPTPWTDPTMVPVYGDLTIAKYTDSMIQNDFAGRWDLDGATLSPVVGWMYRDRHGDNWERQIYEGTVNITAPHPDVVHYPRSAYDRLDTDLTESQKTYQIYAYLQAVLLKNRLYLSGGSSRVTVDNWSVDHNNNNDKSTLKGSHYTYSAGVLYKPVSNVSVYYSYSTNATATDAGRGSPPRWRDGTQHEIGVKSEFLDQRLSFSVAHFEISQNNISTPNPLRGLDPSQPAVLFQDQTNRGIEFEVTGGLTKNLSVIASYANQRLRDTLDRRVRNVPDDMANLLLNYHVDKSLSFYVGMNYVGDTAAETAPGSLTDLGVVKQVSVYVPSRTIFNAGGAYRFGHASLNLNIENLTDKKGIWQASGRTALVGFTPINVKATLRYSF
jgi:outer membrane receptor protein involved in Fe transport